MAKGSRTYWREREAAATKLYKENEQLVNDRVKEIYLSMYDSCIKEIEIFYQRYASRSGMTLAEAKKKVSQTDIRAYERKAKKYVEEKNFSKKANEEMALYNATMRINRMELLKANIGLEMAAQFDELNRVFDETLTERSQDELRRQAGLLGKTVQDNAKMAETIAQGSFYNATYSERLWTHQDSLKSELDRLLQQGLIAGRSPREMARTIMQRFDASRSDAERLMQTELARVQTAAQKESFERYGYDEYEFIANPKCCDVCQALDGRIFKVSRMMPGENAAPIHPNCRCSVAAYVEENTYEDPRRMV